MPIHIVAATLAALGTVVVNEFGIHLIIHGIGYGAKHLAHEVSKLVDEHTRSAHRRGEHVGGKRKDSCGLCREA